MLATNRVQAEENGQPRPLSVQLLHLASSAGYLPFRGPVSSALGLPRMPALKAWVGWAGAAGWHVRQRLQQTAQGKSTVHAPTPHSPSNGPLLN